MDEGTLKDTRGVQIAVKDHQILPVIRGILSRNPNREMKSVWYVARRATRKRNPLLPKEKWRYVSFTFSWIMFSGGFQ